MDALQKADKPGMRIQWDEDDIEAASCRDWERPRALKRSCSMTSVGSGRSIRQSIEPASALPIQYRTVSIQIEDSKAEKLLETKKAKDVTAKELSSLDWHTISLEEICQRLSTSIRHGLSSDGVARKMKEHGKNINSPPSTHYTKRILGYFVKGFGGILFIGGILVFVSWRPLGNPSPAVANLALAIVLIAVFFVQAAFNAWQDWSSSRVMAGITQVMSEDCLVTRGGRRVVVQAADIVPGDMLYIKAGNKLPADVRFVEISSGAKFDRSILTGESASLPGTVNSMDDNFLGTRNIGLQGTHCVSGSGLGVVVATGDNTVFGRIAKLTNEPATGLTPLEKEVLNFVYIIVAIMVTMIVLLVVVWAAYIRKKYPDWISVPTLIVSCVSVAIAFIPEGLPIAVASTLTITANIMRKNKVVCKSLKTVETLGSVSVICSDKTGTLTKNKMYATQAAMGSVEYTPEAARDAMVKQDPAVSYNNAISQLRSLAGLCNAGEFDAATLHLPLSQRKLHGDATDQAILRLSEALGPVSELKAQWVKTFELAFDSKIKYMIRTFVLAQAWGLDAALDEEDNKSFELSDTLLTIKGAPDILIKRCSTFIDFDGVQKPLDSAAVEVFSTMKDKWSSQGKRVVLMARKVIHKAQFSCTPNDAAFEDEAKSHASTDLVLVGLVGIVDPPRDEIPSVIFSLRSAGIRIFMVTGDYVLTAQAIASEIGIITNVGTRIKSASDLSREGRPSSTSRTIKPAHTRKPGEIELQQVTSIVVSGPELMTFNEAQWDQLCSYDEIVFARTTPEQKLRIVREFQARKDIVGMTGDGVNDAPSLAAADIGIAMGSGSDIAIEAADMVLLESFSAIVIALVYGRTVFDNLKKTIAYLLPAGSFSEFWPVFTNVVFGLPQILSSFHMIVVCCFTDCAGAVVLAYEAPESNVLLRRPRCQGVDKLVSWQLIFHAYAIIGVLESLASFTMAYWYLERQGLPFSLFWFKYGALPDDVDSDFVSAHLAVASSIYFVNLIIMQWFNLLAVRTRRLSLIQHPPIGRHNTRNLLLFPAMAFGLVMIFFWCYIPVFHRVLATAPVPVAHFFLPGAFGMGILLLDEGRKYVLRRKPESFLQKFAW